jgi:hypothetical protein
MQAVTLMRNGILRAARRSAAGVAVAERLAVDGDVCQPSA